MKKSLTGEALPAKIVTYLFIFALIVVAIIPAIWMLSTSIKGVSEIFTIPPKIFPDSPTFENYITVLHQSKMYSAFFNSVFITTTVVVLTLFLSILAGYGLARYRFRGSKVIQMAVLFGQMMPAVVIIIPLYMSFTRLKLINTHFSLIFADLALTIPMGVVMFSSFFRGIPKELEEAAKIDGTTGLGALFRVILPISTPGITAVAIYTFINAWEEFLFALNFSTSQKTVTLPLAIHLFASEFVVDWGATMSAATVVALPVLLLFLLCNKYFVQGLSDGSVKG
ncbi:MAG: carbohydrate ABC transporter permease [Acetanaerobacterium sp.]